VNPELDRKLRSLRLSGMALALSARNQEAIHHQLAYRDFLELLVEDELAQRRDRLFARRLKQASLPEVKTLEEFDWSFILRSPRPCSWTWRLPSSLENMAVCCWWVPPALGRPTSQ
jgi:DNA replication protein DnaC